jgi:copper chaperone CopZ
VLDHDVDYRTDTAIVVFDPAVVSVAQLEDALDDVGFRPAVAIEASD